MTIAKQIIIDDQKKTIHRLQQECTEKTNTILALGDKLKCKEQECKELKKVNEEKNELLAKLGCPTIATARMKAFTLQQQLDQLKVENESHNNRLEKLHKTLIDIKEIAEKNNKTEEELLNISISKFSMGALNGRHNLASEILQKIKEVMPDEN